MGKSVKKNQYTKSCEQLSGWHNQLTIAIFIGLCILIFYPPYLRAMFFTREQLPTHILTYVIFFLWCMVKYKRKDSSFLTSPLDYCIFIFVLTYVFSFTIAINTRGAIQEFLKVSNYFLIYWLVSQLVQTKKEADALLNVLVFSALGVAILGLGAAAGSWPVAEWFVDGRIYSTFNYPNSLAAFLTGAFFVSLGLMHNAEGNVKRLYTATAFILAVTTILTYSRGGWLNLFAFSVIYVFVVPKNKRLEAVLVIGTVFVTGAVLVPVITRAFTGEWRSTVWLFIFLGIFLVLVIQRVVLEHTGKLKPALLIMIAAIFAAGTLLPVGIYVWHTMSQPLQLAHARDEVLSEKTLEQRISVRAGAEYTFSMDLSASDAGEHPFSWMLTITGERDEGMDVLLREWGGGTIGWENKQFLFTIPADVHKISVSLYNTYPATSFQAKNLTISNQSVRKLSFALNRLLPGLLYERLFGIKLGERNVAERFVFYQDAMRIVRDYPLWGLGGQGWRSRYFQYQTAPYSTEEVHNHFLQVWIETGILGFLIFIGIWVTFFYSAYISYKNGDDRQKILVAAAATGVFAVLSHSLFDFNLSFASICIFIFSLMGIVRAFMPKTTVTARTAKPLINIMAAGIAVLLLVFTSILYAGFNAHVDADEFMRTGQYSRAVEAFEKAAKYDPYYSEIRQGLAAAYEAVGMQTQNSIFLRKAQDQYQKAIKVNPYHPRYYSSLGGFLVRTGKLDEGLDYLGRAIVLQPFLDRHYTLYADACLYGAEYFYSVNDHDTAEKYLQKIFRLENQIAKFIPEDKTFAFAMGQANYLRGETDAAIGYLESAMEVTELRADAAMILALIYEKKNQSVKATEIYNQALSWDAAAQATYERLRQF